MNWTSSAAEASRLLGGLNEPLALTAVTFGTKLPQLPEAILTCSGKITEQELDPVIRQAWLTGEFNAVYDDTAESGDLTRGAADAGGTAKVPATATVIIATTR